MDLIRFSDIDYRNILIQNYKELGLNEKELVVLLLIDSSSKDKKSLFSGELLSLKMNYNDKEIDELIVSLMNKGFLSYIQCGDILVTSCENTYKKIIELFTKKVCSDQNDLTKVYTQEAFGEITKLLEENMKRSLSPLEIDMISEWFNEDVDKNVIINSINECIMKHNKVTVKMVDKLIIKNLTHTDRMEEGFSTVDEKTKKDIKKAMDIASYDWVNRDDK